ncbi:protein kinase family protein [Amycolatopsis anabasis]|uniref:protein kinase family protein n=1 Tax=Amycolatopsis anabasis TaxID=1840409 RepID=UPI00131D5BA1|nr:protein kinase family protein [Amycolatopsis anabasis]
MVVPVDPSHAARLARYGVVATALDLLSDRQVGELVDRATPLGTGIGGTSVSLEVEGTPVFAKRVPLTDLERRPENVRSTANLFGLPPFYHYGVGSAGGGVWRELAAHAMTTHWVLTNRSENFPLLYHWRVLDGPPARPPGERDEITRWVEYWDGSPAVRARLEALAGAPASVVLFCEHLPWNLHDWLTERVPHEGNALALVERDLRAGTSFMNSHGLWHFDAHFQNILTDGHRLYFSDFGLATSTRFDLAESEADFLGRNSTHDGCYVVTQWVNWLVTALAGTTDRSARVEFVRRCAERGDIGNLPGPAAAIVQRYAPIAAVLNEFYGKLFFETRTAPYPAAEIQQVCAATGFEPA